MVGLDITNSISQAVCHFIHLFVSFSHVKLSFTPEKMKSCLISDLMPISLSDACGRDSEGVYYDVGHEIFRFS